MRILPCRNGLEGAEISHDAQAPLPGREGGYGAATNGSASPLFGSSLAPSPQAGFSLPHQAPQHAQRGGSRARSPELRSSRDMPRQPERASDTGAYLSPLDAVRGFDGGGPPDEARGAQQQPVQAAAGGYGSPVDLGRGGYCDAPDLASHGRSFLSLLGHNDLLDSLQHNK